MCAQDNSVYTLPCFKQQDRERERERELVFGSMLMEMGKAKMGESV